MYYGGKNGNGTYQNIINKIPPHKVYVELFLGSGAILNNKKPAMLKNVGVEKNKSVIDKFIYNRCAEIVCTCAIDFLKKNKSIYDKSVFIYIDPPYPIKSRKHKKEVYEHELTDEQHEDLLKIIVTMTANIAISTYNNSLYHKYLKDWNLYKFQSQTRAGLATEYLYMNYPTPTKLHDYSFLGENFTDRQRIKRKINREITKLRKLPELERNAILNALLQV